MKRLTLVFCCAAVGLLGVAALMLLRKPQTPVSAPLNLPDGSRVRVLAVTYGTNHIVGPPFARWVARAPAPAQPLLLRLFGQRAQVRASTTTPVPTLVVWLEQLTKATNTAPSSAYFGALLSDRSGFTSGERVSGGWSSLEPLHFRVFPRRDAVFALNFFYHTPKGEVKRCGSLPLANPAPGTFPQWQAEALPASKRAGDVEVTLEKLSTGHDDHAGYTSLPGGGHALELGTNRLDGRNQTACVVRLRSLANTNAVWQVAGEEVSDPTGNRVGNTSIGWGGNADYFIFEPGLWLSESAWKLKCEIKRTQGFASGETFTFQDVPLGTGPTINRLNWTTNFGGLTVTLKEVVRRPPLTNHNSWSSTMLSGCSFIITGRTNGQYLDLLSVRTDNGTNLQVCSWGGSDAERSYSFLSIPAEAKTADFTFAVQLARWVEFTVKPQVGLPRLEIPPQGKR